MRESATMTEPTTTEYRATEYRATDHRAAAMTESTRLAASNRPQTVRRPSALAAALAAAALAAPVPALAELPGTLELVVREQPHERAGPAAPSLGVFPIQLLLDDGGAEGSVGVADAGGAREFLWFNRFDQPPGPGFVLEEVWVLFPVDPNVAPGDAIELAVYQDPDGDPTNGADLLATFDVTVQAADGLTFSVYPLAAPVTFTGPGDVLIGAVPRFIEPGDPLTSPAAIDNTASQGRSWLAIWTGDPPDDPELPPDSLITTVDDLGFPGNWMIRGFGSEQPALEIPALGGPGLAGLAALLLLAGLVVLIRRRRSASAAGLALLAALAAPAVAGAQVVVDDFTTSQATITAPPDAASSVVTGGADILGQRRDLAATILSGAGPASAGVAGGVLDFAVADTTPDSRGEALVTWDGDSDPDVLDPDGLGGVDLTAGGQGALRLTVESAGGGVQVEIEVHTDADQRSRASRVLPAIVATTDVFFDFAELVPSPGATGPADLTQVGALTLRLLATEGTLTASGLATAPPQVEAVQADFTDAGAPIGGGSVVPGETFRYRVTIDNTGGGAEGVDLSNVLDPALIPGTFRTTPVVRPDQYTGFGNVELVVDGVGLPDLVANDADPDGDPVNVVPAADLATAQGGEVDVAADGTFAYSPPPGFNGVDTFTYTVAPVAGDPTEDASDNPVGPFTGTVLIALDRTVWFVDNSHGGPFEGTQTNPFATLGDAETASGPGDIIRLRRGDGTTTGYDLGMIMKDGQHLIGGGVPLVIEGQTIEPADPGGRPQVTHGAGGHAVELVSDHVIHGVDVVDSDLSGMHGVDVGSLEVRETSITGAGAEAMDILGGDLDVELDVLSSDGSPTHGLRLASVTGSLTVAGSTTVSSFSGLGGNGIEIVDSPGVAVDLGATTVGGSPLAGPVSGGSGVAGLAGVGVHLVDNPGATITFDSLSVSAPGIGLIAENAGTVNVDSATATVAGAAGAAVEISDTAGQTNGVSGWTFQSLASSNSGGFGVFLDGLIDDFLVTGSIQIDEIGGTAILVSDCPGRSIDFGTVTAVDDNVGGGATADGIDLFNNNAGAVFTFDNLTMVTDGGFGLRAGASTLAFGVGNFIAANGGPALDLDGTTIGGIAPLGGGSEANFVEITSVGSPGHGVSLVGVTGEMFVAGGFIQNSAGTAFRVDAGAPVVTYFGEITQPNAALVVEVEGTSGGAVSFPGQVTGTAAALGVRLDGNAGNVAFDGLDLGTAGTPLGSTGVTLVGGSTGLSSFADMQVFTTGASGFHADNGGVVEVTGAGNRVTTTNGTAVRIFGGTTIGPNEVTLQRVDAGGSTHGIRLDGAGSSFTVTGVGSTAGSGGTLANITQRGIEVLSTDDVSFANMTLTNASTTDAAANCDNTINTGCHAPIHLAAVTGAMLDNVAVDGSTQQGLNGVGVSGLSVISSSILNAGDEVNEGSVRLINLSGTSQITDSDIGLASERAALIENTSAPNLVLSVDGSTFRDTSAGLGADGLEMAFFGTSTATLDVTSSSFLRNRTNGIQVIAEDTAQIGIDVTGSTFLPQPGSGIGLDLATADSGSLTFNVIGNPMIYSDGGPAVNVFSIDTGTIEGRINDNPDVRVGGAGTAGLGIRVQVNEDARGIVEISGNTISEIGFDAGIQVISRLKVGPACGTGCIAGRLDATIAGNDVAIDAGGLYDVWVQANDSNTTCANVTDNTGSGAGIAAFRERTNAAESTVVLEGFVTDATATWNANGNTPAGSVSSSNNGTLVGGTCATVSHPLP